MAFFAKRQPELEAPTEVAAPEAEPSGSMPPLMAKLFAMMGLDPQQLEEMTGQVRVIVADMQARLSRIEAKQEEILARLNQLHPRPFVMEKKLINGQRADPGSPPRPDGDETHGRDGDDASAG
jgi:hypothetical protein